MAEKFEYLEAAKIALDDAMRKTSEIRKKQWDISLGTAAIFAFIFTDKGVKLESIKCEITSCAVIILAFYLWMFCQNFENRNTFIKLYEELFREVVPAQIRNKYVKLNKGSQFEDEARYWGAMAAVVIAAFGLLLFKTFGKL